MRKRKRFCDDDDDDEEEEEEESSSYYSEGTDEEEEADETEESDQEGTPSSLECTPHKTQDMKPISESTKQDTIHSHADSTLQQQHASSSRASTLSVAALESSLRPANRSDMLQHEARTQQYPQSDVNRLSEQPINAQATKGDGETETQTPKATDATSALASVRYDDSSPLASMRQPATTLLPAASTTNPALKGPVVDAMTTSDSLDNVKEQLSKVIARAEPISQAMAGSTASMHPPPAVKETRAAQQPLHSTLKISEIEIDILKGVCDLGIPVWTGGNEEGSFRTSANPHGVLTKSRFVWHDLSLFCCQKFSSPHDKTVTVLPSDKSDAPESLRGSQQPRLFAIRTILLLEQVLTITGGTFHPTDKSAPIVSWFAKDLGRWAESLDMVDDFRTTFGRGVHWRTVLLPV
jgi:hypothetical protein